MKLELFLFTGAGEGGGEGGVEGKAALLPSLKGENQGACFPLTLALFPLSTLSCYQRRGREELFAWHISGLLHFWNDV